MTSAVKSGPDDVYFERGFLNHHFESQNTNIDIKKDLKSNHFFVKKKKIMTADCTKLKL